MSLGAIHHSLSGIQSGLQQANHAAFEIAKSSKYPIHTPAVERPDQVEQLVNLKEAQLQVGANAKALKQGYDTLGSIIDTFA